MSRLAPVRRRAFRQSAFWRWARWPLLAGTVLVLLAVAAFAFLYVTVDLPDDVPEPASSVVVDAHGEELAALQKDGLRFPVELADVAPVVIDALVAAEDQRFFEHRGVDPIGLARAVVNNVGGGELQGASTITQQLVKNSYLGSERTVRRKITEAVLAVKLERTADKDEILQRYLNLVYFGRGAYGIEAAARVYFDTTASDLTVEQAALLIGLLRSPEAADPAEQPEVATERRNTVIDALVEYGSLRRGEAERLKAAPLAAVPRQNAVTLTAGVAPHFVEWIRQQAIAEVGEEAVYGGGLRIVATLDLDDQRAAEAAIAQTLTAPGDPQAALVALDRDGNIKAYVGGRDFDALQVDLARGAAGGGSGRQPGSTFKPFVLASALEQGIPLGTTYPAPRSITLETSTGPYEVENYGGAAYGTADLVSATSRSINTVYAQLAQDVGAGAIAELASKAGVTAELAPTASLALGTSEVSVTDIAAGYLTFARAGEQVSPRAIVRIEDGDGRVLYEAPPPQPVRAIAEGPALAVTHALRAVLRDGTGRAARLDRPAAGKTGTTQGYGDAWFAGYTPDYAAAVWLGHPEGPHHAMTDVQGGPVTGGGLPAEIWQRFMQAAVADLEPSDFPPPPDELLRRPPPPERRGSVTPTSGRAGTAAQPRVAGRPTTTTVQGNQPTTTTHPGNGSTTTIAATTSTSSTTTSSPTTSSPTTTEANQGTSGG